MSQRSTEVKVGIAVILAAVILILAVVWIGDLRVSRKTVAYTVYFREVGGLGPGDPVTVVGLTMGKVGPMDFENGRVKVQILLEPKVTLRSDAMIEVRSVGLMGEKFVYISPGTTGEILPPGSVIEGRYEVGFSEMATGMEQVFAEVQMLSQSLRRILAVEETTHAVSQTLTRIDRLTEELLVLINENKEDVRGTAKSLRLAADNLNEVLGPRKQEIGTTIDRLNRAAGSLDSLSQKMNVVATDLAEGKGTLGMLVKDKQLYEDMRSTIANVDSLINDIRQHPERYINLKIF